MSTNATEVSLSHDLPRLLKCCLGAIFTFSILAENVIIIIALLHSKKHLVKQTQLFLLNVALIDLLTGILIVPLLTVIEISTTTNAFSRLFYLYWLTVGGLMLNARVLALVIVSLDRYLSICYPMRYQNLLTFWRARLSLIIIWVLAVVMLLPRLAVFSTELVRYHPNATGMVQKPHDWTYATSPALRGVLVVMFFLRFVFPLALALVTSILAFRVAVQSSEGLRQGVLKVKEPEVRGNSEEEQPLNSNHLFQSPKMAPKKPTLMRIHRGNYMTEGTKELFAQLPGTHRSLSRRTAVLPNIDLDASHDLEMSPRSDSAHVKARETAKVADISNTKQNIGSENTDSERQPSFRYPWWRSSRMKIANNRFKFNRKKLKDLGSMIPSTLLLVAFIAFSLPYQFLQVLKALWTRADLPHEVDACLYWLACANALINPVILTFWSLASRAKVLRLISCGRLHQNQAAIKRLIIASFGTANLPYGRQVRPHMLGD